MTHTNNTILHLQHTAANEQADKLDSAVTRTFQIQQPLSQADAIHPYKHPCKHKTTTQGVPQQLIATAALVLPETTYRMLNISILALRRFWP